MTSANKFRFIPGRISKSISLTAGVSGATWGMATTSSSVRPYQPANPNGEFPYSTQDLTPMDHSKDDVFYAPSRFVTHIDDNAIISLKKYYDDNLPRKGRILDFCSSWVSHFPPALETAAKSGELEILGTGMNEQELKRNPVLKRWWVQDLNENPELEVPGEQGALLDESTCVVSIDYLRKPVEVLSSLRSHTRQDGRVHLAISNRCFPTKAVSRWLKVNEEERLNMVGDYLWWAGWRDIEIVTVVNASWMRDPLWVVRASKPT